MAYTKSFQASITIYPTFEQDSYCQYFREQLSEWITDCFNAYTDFFKITVSQAKGTAILYTFDVESGDVDLKLKKLWVKSPASYTIDINGSGIINYGVKNNLEPPQNILEDSLDKIYLKYQETSDIYPPKIITYGKHPQTRRVEVPIQYSFDAYDGEQWEDGSRYYDVYTDKWRISVNTSSDNFLNIIDLIDEFNEINKSEKLKIYMDDFDNHVEAEGQFILKNQYKEKYLKLLNKLAQYYIEDDLFEVDEISMNFIADSTSTFYFEKYFLDDTIGQFKVKNLEI